MKDPNYCTPSDELHSRFLTVSQLGTKGSRINIGDVVADEINHTKGLGFTLYMERGLTD